ncbi:MAG: NAD-dependent epimerase/dehydratase family protein [Planctomycetaceae bacterium]|nr:NAD-dependent epimerase/dehydratase family protein [Planctomycetaceae bacterium]
MISGSRFITGTCLILGGRGFVGSGVAVAAREAGWDVTVAGRAEVAGLSGARFDVVINANGNASRFRAEQDPWFDFEASLVPVYHSLFDFEYERYVFLSTVDVYNDTESSQGTREETLIDPLALGAYGFHKRQAELCVMRTCPKFLVLRLGQMIGSGLKKGPVYDIINDQPLWIDPTSRLPFMNTTNVGRVLFQLLGADVDSQVFNVCGRTSIEFSRVMELVPTVSSQQESLESAVQVYEVATDKLEKICSVPDSWDEIKTFVSEALGE